MRRPGLLLLVVGLLAAVALVPAVAAPVAAGVRPTAAAAHVAPRLVKPNIVYLLTDDEALDAFTHMPYVMSRRDWVSFSNSTVETSLCCPSRVTGLTGLYDTHSGVTNNGNASNYTGKDALPCWLQGAGYATGIFGKLHNGKGVHSPVDPCWTDYQVTVGTQIYGQYDYYLNDNGTVEWHGSAPQDYSVDLTERRAEHFIDRSAATGQPFYVYYTPTATHAPWIASPTRRGSFSTAPVHDRPNVDEADRSDKPAWVRTLTPPSRSVMTTEQRKTYAAALSVDDAIARLDARLAADGLLSSTVVVLATDNGYSFGSHDWVTKRCPYEECLQTPLMVRYPGQRASVDAHAISNVDYAATIADIAGTVPATRTDGRSFLPFVLHPGLVDRSWPETTLHHWAGGDVDDDGGTVRAIPQFWAVRSADRYVYVELDTGEREFYDLAVDPYELHNDIRTRSYAPVIARARRELAARKVQADAGPATAPDAPTNRNVPGSQTELPDLD